MKRFVALLVLVMVAAYSRAQIAMYTGSGGLSTAVVGVANETVTALTAAGFGANTPCTSGGLSGLTVNTIFTSYNPSTGPKVTFKITPNAGYMLNVTGFTAGLRRSGTGPANTRFAYSLDNGATWVDDGVNHSPSSGGCGSTSVSSWGGGTLPTAITSTTNGIIIALFPFASSNSSGTYQINSIVIDGTVTLACTQPTIYAVTGGGAYCAGGTGVAVGVANSQTGVTYQLYNGATTVGTPVSGTGAAISFGLQTAAGTYTVLATNTATSCTVAMSGSAVITINPLPSALAGPLSVCQGTTGALTSTPAGGTWVSTPTSVATVSTGGVVSGVGAGTATISYTLSTGCASGAIVTVTPAPGAITGMPVVCLGLTTSLANTVTGGTWSSSNASIASIDGATGVVTGVATGTTVISYVAGSCNPVTVVVTVNPLAPITGAGTVCEGQTTTLTNINPTGAWASSNTAVGTVNASTGVVTGIVAGTTVISYTLATGCQATTIITVNPAAAAITGTAVVCAGSITVLSSASPGGTWLSSNTTIAAVAPDGVAGGVAAGTAAITYTLPTGCATVRILTVNPLPAPISGSPFVCQGSTVTLTDATPAGIWSSSNPSIATVSSTGVLSGSTIGSSYITYQLPTGCFTYITASVNPLPAAITGASIVCIALSTPFADATPGGTWSSANTAIATVNASSGLVTGVAAGSTLISYVFGSGCYSTKVVSVNTAGAGITGPAVLCETSSISLSNAVPGGVWTSTDPLIATVAPATGLLTAVSAGTTTISYTTASCNPSLYTITVNPLPSLITGIFNVCVGSVTTLSNATPGGTWSIAGPLATISTDGVVSGLSAGTSAFVTYTLPTGCMVTAPIVVDGLPAAITGPDSICQYASLTLSDATPGGIWSSTDGTIASAVAATGVVTGVVPGSVIISYTLVSGCHVEMPFRVLTPLAASVSISVSPDTAIICEGTPVKFVAHATNGGAHPLITWQKFTIDTVVADSFTYIPTHGDYISVKMLVDGICAAPSPAYDYKYLDVYPVNVSPSVVISTGAMQHALQYPGQVFTFYSDVTYGGMDPEYQWYMNDIPVPGATNNTFVTELYRSVYVYCKVTGNPPCSAGTTGISNSVLIEAATGVPGMESASDLMIFPNPNSGEFNLGGTEHVASEVTVEVTDLLGRTVYSGVVSVRNERISTSISMKDAAPGAYFLQVISGTERKRIQFVVR